MPTTRRKPKAKSTIPLCISAAFLQCSEANPHLALPTGQALICVGDIPRHRKIVAFFAGKDLRRPESLKMWGAVQQLTGAGDAFESEAASLLRDVILYAPNSQQFFKRHTRTKLRELDAAVIAAVDRLIAALDAHTELGPMPSARYWTPEFRAWLEKYVTFELPDEEDEVPTRVAPALDERWPLPEGSNISPWWMEQLVPPIKEMLHGVRADAVALQAKRMRAPKLRQTDDVHLVRNLLFNLLFRHGVGKPSLLAKIVAPIVDTYGWSDASFTRVEGVAKDLMRSMRG